MQACAVHINVLYNVTCKPSTELHQIPDQIILLEFAF